ncbi:LysM peptidoglycan-binding domain-containing protein [Microbacterium pseudoresistens]|uniref:LysM repeat protein n=1 Tax=Microbacterium pseudoresistens TaxID=640634 RepID=A0A7Y9EXP4_9MICO|nr:LysM peptidoglycan-binding domain-containing protein [Microbacterium pseudoresistens]NYD55691.1 LysM repeat protein [Microbacterium pseudoresistens]
MSADTALRRNRTLRWAVPAAIATTMVGSLVTAPAHAAPLPRGHHVPDPLLSGDEPLSGQGSASGASSVAGSHTVVDGDTPYGIAARYGISVHDLLAWNGLGGDAVIYPGDVLALAAPAAPAPESGGDAPAAPGSAYEVVAGDTLWAIAQAHGTSVDALYAVNGFGPDSIIYPGQTIVIPGADAAAPAPASTPDPAPVEDEYPAVAPWTALDAEQADNAAWIIAVGRELGVPDRGIAIGLAAAMVESSLRNLDWGDRDSLGLFQQRPSAGWGTPEQILDRDRSIRVFFGGDADPNGSATRGLLDIAGWEQLAFTDAAQAVQISAYPLRYGAWEQNATRWLAELG